MKVFKFKFQRPKFAGRAAFKTLLRRNKFDVPRDFYGRCCCIIKKGNRLYRFRFAKDEVDVSCPLGDFDRWANSTELTMSIKAMKVNMK